MVKDILRILPASVRQLIQTLPTEVLVELEEIRIRVQKPLEVIWNGRSEFITPSGKLTSHSEEGFKVNPEDCIKLMNLISNHSLYTLEEELKRGYITIPGGHRIGISGKVILQGGGIHHIKEITSFNIRFAREKVGAASKLLPYLFENRSLRSTLIISPPQCGKTTLLRDLVRQLSYGSIERHISSYKIGLVDERSEIAGCVMGIPQKDVGPRTDVLDGCPKAEGMMMMIRSMSPDILVADEIGRKEDVYALQEALHAGVKILTTAHGTDIDEVARRPTLSQMIQQRFFERYVILSRKKGPGTIHAVYDDQFRSLLKEIVQ
ncbi:stage III sporulation protein AA [Microaerobacter geothermalis]|uniref:stage III sporulation protein AA n=1 Tax=Microaerobacter geothermalis TaxID=674972 RepID=UPI001F284972|nr:stage III sporulation protein AA [Microaerobacter geothermalis]MCF6094457.1 stage III sporulation protein AA [Microaerobacter geothermalis]